MDVRMIDYCAVISFSPIYRYLLDQLISKISDLLRRVLDYLGLALMETIELFIHPGSGAK